MAGYNNKYDLTAEQVNLLIREGEGLTIEFKEHYTSRIDEDIVAFSNAKGGAVILGVRDDGTIAGEQLTNDLKAKINSLTRNCKPSITVETMQIGRVTVIVVPEGTEKPYSCSSGYYRRLDATTQKMNHDELRIMFAENEPLPFEEMTVRKFSFDDVSKAKIRNFVKEADIRIGTTGVPEFLRSLRVADAVGVKNAGILFFAKDVYSYLHQAQMTLLAFKGTDRFHIYDRYDVRDDLLTQFNEAVLFLKKHLNVRSVIRGVNREDIYEIPLEVLREALVNALMHRDYSIAGTQLSVEVYDDRVEIANPGGLPKGLSLKDFGKVSVRRNELIADLFFRLHKVERIGMGIRKMKEAMVEAGLSEPTFMPDGFFCAIFYRLQEFALKKDIGKQSAKGWAESPRRLVEGLVEGLVENQKKILIMAAQNPHVSKSIMSKELGISATAIDKNITVLKKRGLLRRVGPAKGGYWEVMEE
ncbi:MAG: putative DNA binding domain-containing protein [Syntrophaceae bacterium]|nr:putative DNA binding domain-containing protein [Syntrophaceae bacterium]